MPAYWRIETTPDVLLFPYVLVGRSYRALPAVSGRAVVSAPFALQVDVPALVPATSD